MVSGLTDRRQDPGENQEMKGRKERQGGKGVVKKVFICSPFRPTGRSREEKRKDLEKNISLAKGACRYAVGKGFIPYAPHIYFPGFLSDADADERELGILGLLPISGESGTLRARRSVVQYPLKGNVVAKTGTIRNVRNLAGYVKSDKGKFIPFVVYTTGFSPDAEEVNYMNNNKTLWPNFEFEKRVLSYLYEEKEPVIAK